MAGCDDALTRETELTRRCAGPRHVGGDECVSQHAGLAPEHFDDLAGRREDEARGIAPAGDSITATCRDPARASGLVRANLSRSGYSV